MNNLDKNHPLNGQSAAKPLLNEEGSEIIPRKGSRLEEFLSEKPDISIYNLFEKRKFDKTCCIYCIFSKAKMLTYIGSTLNLRDRLRRHNQCLVSGKHHGIYLQRVFNKYTFRDIFTFIIEEVTAENIAERETYWINYFDSVNNGFNASYDTQRNFINEDIKRRIKEKNSKPVLMFTPEGLLVKEFPSVKDAATFVGDQSTNISGCCKGKNRIIKNHVFRYKSDNTPFNLRPDNTGCLTKEHLEKCKLATSKKVICDGIIYDSISDAEKINNISRGCLGKSIKYNKLYKGKLFKYYEDMIQNSSKDEL